MFFCNYIDDVYSHLLVFHLIVHNNKLDVLFVFPINTFATNTVLLRKCLALTGPEVPGGEVGVCLTLYDISGKHHNES